MAGKTTKTASVAKATYVLLSPAYVIVLSHSIWQFTFQEGCWRRAFYSAQDTEKANTVSLLVAYILFYAFV